MTSNSNHRSISFDLDASTLLQELIEDRERFSKDELNTSLARQLAFKAWHMCDHTYKQSSSFKSLRELQHHVKSQCSDLEYMQDICNATKHAEVKRYTPRIMSTELHQGAFSNGDWDRSDWDVSRLQLIENDGSKVDFLDSLDRVIQYWSNFFCASDFKTLRTSTQTYS